MNEAKIAPIYRYRFDTQQSMIEFPPMFWYRKVVFSIARPLSSQ
jgi:hypothetical protein